MNKAKLVENMAKLTKLPRATCKAAVEAFMDVVSKSLRNGKSVSLTDFGTFGVMQRQARWGVNPATGDRMKIRAKKVPKWRPGKALREMVE